MAKKPNQTQTPENNQTPEENLTSTTESSTSTQQIDSTQDSSTEPRRVEPAPDVEAAKVQQSFLDTFEEDEDDLGEDPLAEGQPQPVKTAGAKAPAQSAETSTTPQLDKDGKPIPAQAAPADTSGDLQEEDEEGKPATTPKKVEEPAKAVEEQPAAQAQTPEQIAQRYSQWRGQTEDLLAKHHYAFTQEQIDEMDVNPGEFISKAMSRVYLDAVTATLTQVTQHLPRMVEQINQQAANSVKSEDTFYERWPKLKDHADTVLRVAAVYRQLNPTASTEDFVNEVGAQTMVALRLTPEDMGIQTQKPNGKQAPAFRPASSTPAGGAQSPAQTPNIFAQLADEFEEELDSE